MVRRRRGPDLRLLPLAACAWLAVILTVLTRTPWIAVGCLAVAVVSAGLYHRSGPFRAGRTVEEDVPRIITRTTALVAMVAAAVSARAAWLVARVDRHVLRTGQTRLNEEVALATAPKQLDGGTVLLNVTVEDLGDVPMFINVRLIDGADHQSELLALQPGTLLQVTATARDTDRPSLVPVRLSAVKRPEITGLPDGIAGVTAHLRDGLSTAAAQLPWETGTLVPGMVVGDISMQDPQTRQEFLATGLTHLTAVSGANLAIVTGSVLVLATALRAPRWSRMTAAAVCLIAFVVLVGPEPSVLRAAVMGSVGLVAVWSARRAHGYAALSAAVLVLLAVDPGLAVDYAFILSVVATAGIVALAPLITRRLLQYWTDRRTLRAGRHHPPARWQAMLVGLVAVSLAADVVTAPVIVQMTGVVSPTALLANVLVGIAVPPVTMIGMVGALVAGLHTGTGAVMLIGAAAPAWWILTVASKLSQVDVLHTPGGFLWAGLLVVVGAFVVLSVVSHRWRWWSLGGLVGVAVLVVVAVRQDVLSTGPYAEITDSGAGFVRTWSEDLSKVDWTLGVRPVEGGHAEIMVADDVDPDTVEVTVLPDESSVLTHERSRPQSAEQPPDLYVVTACGRSRGMPSRTPDGVPVAFPCRDGTVVLGADGLHASGR